VNDNNIAGSAPGGKSPNPISSTNTRRFERPTYTQVPNELFELIQHLSGPDLKVLLLVTGRTFSYGSAGEAALIQISEIASCTGLTQAEVESSVASLAGLDLITVHTAGVALALEEGAE
jgi:hypothetical protein